MCAQLTRVVRWLLGGSLLLWSFAALAVEDIYVDDNDEVLPPAKPREALVVKPVEQSSGQTWSAEDLRKLFEPDMLKIPAGKLVMGCQDGRDHYCFPWEKPAHAVTLAAFELSKYEVTQQQWKAVMGSSPAVMTTWFQHCGETCPMESVSWDQVQAFLRILNRVTGQHFRLPSEAEWEYAYRAGTQADFYTGSCIHLGEANYDGYFQLRGCLIKEAHTHDKPMPVGSYPANPWGLYDMAGNVSEWVQDGYHDSYDGAPTDGSARDAQAHKALRVMRGGSWSSGPHALRAAQRAYFTPSGNSYTLGFRLARDVSTVSKP